MDSTYPNPRTARIKIWANAITTGAALIIAVAAAMKQPDGGASEQVYREAVKQLQVLQAEQARQHEDVMALRHYLDDYLRASTVVGPNDKGVTQPTNPNAPVILIPVDKSKIRVTPGPNFQPVLVLPAGQPPPLPDLHASPDPLVIIEFPKIAEQAAAEKALAEKKSQQ